MNRTALRAAFAFAAILAACGPLEPGEELETSSAEQSLARAPKPLVATLRTSSAISANPTFRSIYSLATVLDINHAIDVPATMTGHHTLTLLVSMPGGAPYQQFVVPYAAGVAAGAGEKTATKVGSSYRVWVTLPVAGTMIQTYSLTGKWTATVTLDTDSASSGQTTYTLK